MQIKFLCILFCSRSVLVCDINSKMLNVGKERSKAILSPGQRDRVDWLEGDAENLHKIPDNSFDAYTIAFGIRNCVHIDKVLEEAYRVLRPGGRFMCLEFSHVQNPALKWYMHSRNSLTVANSRLSNCYLIINWDRNYTGPTINTPFS